MLKILMTFLSKPFRTITATKSVTGISTVFHTVDTTTTYLLACTNREIHKPEAMCGGGDGSQPLPAFSFEAPLGTNRTKNVIKKRHTNTSGITFLSLASNPDLSLLQILIALIAFLRLSLRILIRY